MVWEMWIKEEIPDKEENLMNNPKTEYLEENWRDCG